MIRRILIIEFDTCITRGMGVVSCDFCLLIFEFVMSMNVRYIVGCRNCHHAYHVRGIFCGCGNCDLWGLPLELVYVVL